MLRVEQLTVHFGEVIAVDHVDLHVGDGEGVAVLGPSGCGKTTLLRTIAGLQRPDAGRVLWDGEDLTPVPPHRRAFGLMFQDYALFPHRNVFGNVAFGLRMTGMPTDEIAARVRRALELVDLPGYEQRSVGRLSGGEEQRVALARALAPEPRMLMLDEPIGSLDRVLREQLMAELPQTLARLGMTALYVTHDQEEAFAVADRVVVMRAGRVEQEGPVEQVWHRPATEFVARFLGLTNIVEGEADGATVSTRWGRIPISRSLAQGPVTLVVRPDAFSPSPDGSITGTVESRTFRGSHSLVRVRIGDDLVDVEARGYSPPEPGAQISLTVDPEKVVVLDPPADGQQPTARHTSDD